MSALTAAFPQVEAALLAAIETLEGMQEGEEQECVDFLDFKIAKFSAQVPNRSGEGIRLVLCQ